jgi:hypothetical protein
MERSMPDSRTIRYNLSYDTRMKRRTAVAGPFADIRVDRFEMEGVPQTRGTMYGGVAVR